ncbi:MAG: hypothetical protein JKY37_06990 [Nannocystaceae bacterium]|nr:hypothetical protein [Nannocystaceae bacterium]
MTKLEAYQTIIRDVVHEDMQVEHVLLVALVLHTHSISLCEGIDLEDVRPDSGERVIVLAPLTRTDVTQMLSTLWPWTDERGRMDYWFAQYCRTVAYEVFEDVPDGLRTRAAAVRDDVLAHVLIDRLIEE